MITAADLDASQQQALLGVITGGHHVVLGAPGTGTTTTALVTFAEWTRSHPAEDALVLVPTRQRAAALRDDLAARLGRTTGSVLVRTPASLAFAILRLRAAHRGEPTPTLISGPEQDTILGELIAGHLDGEGPPLHWPDRIGSETLRLPAFRAELRDLLMRAAEAGLDGSGLHEMGERYRRPEWCAAGRLFSEYRDVMMLGELTPDRGARYDAATIVDQAVVALQRWDEDVSEQTRPRWSLVLHDDYQDATIATARLLEVMAADGARVAVFGDPDVGVQAFRGGQPSLFQAATASPGSVEGALGAMTHVLSTSWRHGPVLRSALTSLTRRLPILLEDGRRGAGPAGATEPERRSPLVPMVLPTAAQEVAAVARELRVHHLRHGVPWSQMAVIVRTGARVGEIRRGLRTAGVPLRAAIPDRPLREEPAVVPFLHAMRCVLRGSVDPETAVLLLTSPLGGLDSVSLRALRRALRARYGDAAPSEDLLSALLTSGRGLADLDGGLVRAPAAVISVLDAGHAALAEDPLATEMLLWRMWDATSLAQDWQRRALAGGPAADRADADLDAMVALFSAAEQFTDRTTGADPAGFLAHLEQQDFAADTLAARGEDAETVAVHTAASAAGGQWDLVVVSGVQEDAWPDLRIRDTLLGAAQLSEITTGRDSGVARTTDAQISEANRAARASVLADELRSFVSACSRACSTLIVTAVLDTDARPSAFFELLLGEGAQLPAAAPVRAGLDLRGLVGELRGALTGPDQRAAAALELLTSLARAGVAEADPALFAERLAPTSRGPAYDPAAGPIPVSPSSIEKATSCPLHWLLTTAGGKPPSTRAQNVGNLVHEIAADHPHGTVEELQAALAARWPELGLDDSWVARTERARAEQMIRRLGSYLASHEEPVDVEREFEVEVRGARVRGRMDRVEHHEEGLRVVDLKTGTAATAVADLPRHAQLGTYQLAVAEGAFGPQRPAGGSLVFVGTNSKGVTVREQAALADDEDPDWAATLVEQTVRTLTAPTFDAQVSAVCGYCPVRTSCPVHAEGERVVP